MSQEYSVFQRALTNSVLKEYTQISEKKPTKAISLRSSRYGFPKPSAKPSAAHCTM